MFLFQVLETEHKSPQRRHWHLHQKLDNFPVNDRFILSKTHTAKYSSNSKVFKKLIILPFRPEI